MSIYLTHTSARTTWELIGHKGLREQTLCAATRPEDAARTLREIKEADYFSSGFLSHILKPIDLLVPSKDSRIRSKQISSHLCLHDLPEGSLRRLRNDVYVVSPSHNFVQMGEVLSEAQLAAYGLELCGSYSLAPGTGRGFVDRKALVTIDDLLSATTTGMRVRGTKRAQAALAWVREGSRSPRETILFLLLCRPGDKGGYELLLPELNKAVPLSYQSAQVVGVPVLHPDLCWEEYRLLIEYDSDGHHLEEGQVIRDVDRKDAFAKDGWTVITITKDRLWKPEVLDRIVREEIAPLLGCVPPELTEEFLEARRQLRSEIFGFDPRIPLVVNDRACVVTP